jgi:hypothetical protein
MILFRRNQDMDKEEEKPIAFCYAKYIGVLGSNKSLSTEEDAYVYIFEDRIVVKLLKSMFRTEIPYQNMTEIQNIDAAKKVGLERATELGLITGHLWKTHAIITVIKYDDDDTSEPQTIVLDFKHDREYAPPLIEKLLGLRRKHIKYHTNEDQKEIAKINSTLDSDEEVQFVARQARLKPGGANTSPDTIFVTDRRIIIRNPSMLGRREKIESISYDKITSVELGKGLFSAEIEIKASGYGGEIDAIPKDKAFKMVEYIKQAMKNNKAPESSITTNQQHSTLSLADELMKLAKLKEQGIVSEEEFQRMKLDILKKLQ